MAPDGRRIGVIRWPEQAVNFAFGGRACGYHCGFPQIKIVRKQRGAPCVSLRATNVPSRRLLPRVEDSVNDFETSKLWELTRGSP